VGIVFQTDPSRIGQDGKDALAAIGINEPHGLVMAVKNAGTNQAWGPLDTDEGLTNCHTKADNYNDISGYGNCEYIRGNPGGFGNYPAFKAADDYNKTCPVPETTTGWYLPSSGQWWDILQNLGGCPALADNGQQTSPNTNTGDFHWSGQGDVHTALNAWMEKIAADGKNDFVSNSWFWSSSECSDRSARLWYVFSSGIVSCSWSNKRNGRVVRPVLAF